MCFCISPYFLLLLPSICPGPLHFFTLDYFGLPGAFISDFCRSLNLLRGLFWECILTSLLWRATELEKDKAYKDKKEVEN